MIEQGDRQRQRDLQAADVADADAGDGVERLDAREFSTLQLMVDVVVVVVVVVDIVVVVVADEEGDVVAVDDVGVSSENVGEKVEVDGVTP